MHPAPKPPRHLVRWTSAEQAAVRAQLERQFTSGHRVNVYVAMSVLPKHRRRPRSGGLDAWVAEMRETFEIDRRQRAATHTETVAEPNADSAPTPPEPAPAAPTETEPVTATPEPAAPSNDAPFEPRKRRDASGRMRPVHIVRWTDEERRLIAAEGARLWPTMPRVSILDAQKILPRGRWRPNNSVNEAWFRQAVLMHRHEARLAKSKEVDDQVEAARLRQQEAEQRQIAGLRAPLEAAPEPEPLPVAAIAEDIGAVTEVPEASEASAAPRLRDVLLRTMIDFGVDLLIGVVTHGSTRSAIASLFGGGAVRNSEHLPHVVNNVDLSPEQLYGNVVVGTKRAARDDRPVVVVAGLKGHQMQEIADSVGDKINLRFWGSHESNHLLRALSKQADHVVAMTSFIGHPAEQVARASAKHFVRHHGGLTTLKEILSGFVRAAPQPAANTH